LAQPVSGLSLAAFRIAVGIVMLLEAISFFLPSESSGGRSHLDVYYAGKDIAFNLPYPGFGWLPLLPSPWMEGVGILLGVGAVGMVLGFRYRVSALLTFLAWGYLYVVESTRTYWMSYYYLELIVLFLMVWMPAAARWSVDASRLGDRNPSEIPFWPVYLLRAQLVVTYFYAGFAKLNHDWLFEGVPVRIFLEKPWVAARLKSLLPDAWASEVDRAVHSPVLIHFLGWTGAVFDLAIGALLLVRRTRTLGFGLLLVFHGTNHGILFNDIVWFPLLGVATATIFLDPDWPARLGRWLTAPRLPKPEWRWALPGAVLLPGIGALLGWRSSPTPSAPGAGTWTALGRATPALVAAWIAFQSVFPLRNLLIPGDSRYTFEGLSWSWRLKAEVYRTDPCVVTVSDPALAKSSPDGSARFDWAAWRSDRILFREVDPLRIDWSRQPELVVLFDPLMGDRVVYNAQSTNVTDHSEAAARRRVAELWTQLHGRQPEAVNRTVPLSRILEGYDKAMRQQGMRFNNANEVLGTLDRLNGRRGDGRMLPVMRKADPFPLSPKSAQGLVFLQIEDKALFSNPPVPAPRLLANSWKNGPAGVTAWPADPSQATPAVVFCEPLALDVSDLLPSFYAAVPVDRAELLPEIRWNLIRDAGISKTMHIGIQPFLMRRYARRVADAWRKDYGHDPAVHVAANISINGHAPRELVDPKADLLTAPLTLFGHNAWIRNGDRSEFGSTGGPP
jgi:vitamin K-dependent gamma-carboxylase